MKNFGIIKEAAVKFWKNPILALPAALQLISMYIIFVLFLSVSIAISGISIADLSNPDTLIQNLTPYIITALPWILAVGAVLSIALMTIFALFDAILISMLNSKNKIKFNLDGKKFFSRIFWFGIICGIILLIGILILLGLALLAAQISAWLLIIPALCSIGFLLMLPLLSLSPYYVVIGNLKIKDAINKSINVAWRNYFRLLGLILLVALISIAASLIFGLIPVVGELLITILIATYSRICMFMFASDKK